MIFKIVLLIWIIACYFFGRNVIEPLINNDMYMSQMSNDSMSFVLIHGYEYVKTACTILFIVLLASIAYDIYKEYKKNKENDNEKQD